MVGEVFFFFFFSLILSSTIHVLSEISQAKCDKIRETSEYAFWFWERYLKCWKNGLQESGKNKN